MTAAKVRMILLAVFMVLPHGLKACELKLLLAMDVSASLTPYGYDVQRRGLSASFRDPEILDAILALDGVLVGVTQWAGKDQQERSINWTNLGNHADAALFADRIDDLQNPFERSATAIGSGLRHASRFLADAPVECARTVIDVSTDGTTNTGTDTATEANALAEEGVTINVLAVLVLQKYTEAPIVRWLSENLVRGPASFVEVAPTYNDFPTAMRKKLLRELRPQFALNQEQRFRGGVELRQ